MALSKSLPTPYGAASYHLVGAIDNVKLPQPSSVVTLISYRDLDHRNTEFARPYRTEQYRLNGEDALLFSEAQWTAAYEWIKTHSPDLSDAEDV